MLQGLNKAETAEKYGEEQVLIWRRSYDVPPAPLAKDDPRSPFLDPRYKGVDEKDLPLTEALKKYGGTHSALLERHYFAKP